MSKVIAIKKANGEAAHFACIEITGTKYLCIGSKVTSRLVMTMRSCLPLFYPAIEEPPFQFQNVHMLITKKSDIDLYTGSRYGYARDIAYSVIDFLHDLDETTRNKYGVGLVIFSIH